MTSYEIVRRAIEFGKPDRLPMRFDALGACDTHFVGWNQVRPYDVEATVKEFEDEWGCRWMRTGIANMGQPKGHPLGDWRALDRFRWPDPDDPALYEGMAGRFAGAYASKASAISSGRSRLEPRRRSRRKPACFSSIGAPAEAASSSPITATVRRSGWRWRRNEPCSRRSCGRSKESTAAAILR